MTDTAQRNEHTPQGTVADMAPRIETPFRAFVSAFFSSRIATIAFVIFLMVLFIALFAPWISPTDPYDLAKVDILDSLLPPGTQSYTGMTHVLGTDGAGRDMVSAIFYGIRTSLSVGIFSAVIALIIGCIFGLVAASAGGRIETVIMRIVDIQLSFPAILVALILLAVLGKGVDKIIIALVLVQWAYYARTMRGAALVERSKEYVEAATCLGISRIRIIFRHILPNCISPLIVVGTIQAAHAISLEATLSFLGIGLPITEPSLGLLIANGFRYLMSEKYWISIFPGIALLIMIVSINLVGDQLRDVLNPRLEK